MMTEDEKRELADVYEEASNRIQRLGWWKSGVWGNRNTKGDCLVIAIDQVCGADGDLTQRAFDFVSSVLELDGTRGLAGWNDECDRTEDEVINLLDSLANKLR